MLFCKILPKTFKKLVLVLTTFALMTKASKENEIVLEKILYIYYIGKFYLDLIYLADPSST